MLELKHAMKPVKISQLIAHAPKAGSACPFFSGRLNCEISDFAKAKTGELGVELDRRREVLTKYSFKSN